MRNFIGATLLACLTIASCTAAHDSHGFMPPAFTLEDTPGGPLHRAARAPARYIYVTDIPTRSLLVYEANQPDPAPIRTIPLGGIPRGVVTDSQGHVYVSVVSTNTVYEFGSGGQPRMRHYDVFEPYGLAVDPNDNLYVASQNPNSVREFHGDAQIRFVHVPGAAIIGVAVEPNGNIVVSAQFAGSGQIIEMQDNITPIGRGPTTFGGGIAFEPNGSLAIADNPFVTTRSMQVNPNTGWWTVVSQVRVSHGPNLLTVYGDNLIVPAVDRVLIIPLAGPEAIRTITKGIQSVVGAAEGI